MQPFRWRDFFPTCVVGPGYPVLCCLSGSGGGHQLSLTFIIYVCLAPIPRLAVALLILSSSRSITSVYSWSQLRSFFPLKTTALMFCARFWATSFIIDWAYAVIGPGHGRRWAVVIPSCIVLQGLLQMCMDLVSSRGHNFHQNMIAYYVLFGHP